MNRLLTISLPFFLPAFLLLALSCSSLEKTDAPVLGRFIEGPLPEEVEYADVAEHLARRAQRDGVGEVRALLITPALIRLQARQQESLSAQERREKIEQEIQRFYRQQSCFALTLKTIFPSAAEFQYWQAYTSFGDEVIVPTSLRPIDATLRRFLDARKKQEYHYVSFASACTKERLNLKSKITLTLIPQFRPGPRPIRFTWR